jgi:hypothetical protein
MNTTKGARAARRELVERLLGDRERESLTRAEIPRRSGIPQGTLAGWATRLRRDRFKEVGAEKAGPFTELIRPPGRAESDPRSEIMLRGER